MNEIYHLSGRNISSHFINGLPKYLFLIFACSGAALIWLTKMFLPGYGGTIAGIIAVCSIVLYCFTSYVSKSLSIREDVIGDNAYYLGFLYTLTSLSYALANFLNKQNDAGSIIESFGVALISTIAGIIARVFFSQLSQDPDDIQRDTRTKIAETARNLCLELNSATVSFNEYRRGLEQSLSEAFSESKAQLNKSSEQTVATFDELNKRISQIESPDEILNKKFALLFGNFEVLGEKLSSVTAAQAEALNEISKSTQNLKENINIFGTSLSDMSKQSVYLEVSNQNLSNFSTNIKELPGDFQKLHSTITNLVSEQLNAANRITDHANHLEKQLERSRQYTEETHTALSTMTKNLIEKLS